MAIEVAVFDEQEAERLDPERWRQLATDSLVSLGLTGPVELSVSFVDRSRIAELNEEYLGHHGPTDVLSFPVDGPTLPLEARSSGPLPATEPAEAPPLLLGDVVICPEVAAENAPEHAGSFEEELALLLVHGILHLLGMDHEDDGDAEEMEQREQELLIRHFRAGGET